MSGPTASKIATRSIRGQRGSGHDDFICGGAFVNPAAFGAKVKVLFLGIGAAEGSGTRNFSDALMKVGVHNVYFESPGDGARVADLAPLLNDFALRLFK